MNKEQFTKRRFQIFFQFFVEDLENEKTKKSITAALENIDKALSN